MEWDGQSMHIWSLQTQKQTRVYRVDVDPLFSQQASSSSSSASSSAADRQADALNDVTRVRPSLPPSSIALYCISRS